MTEQEAYKFFYHALMALERGDKKALDYYNQIYFEEWGECGISEQSPLYRVLKQANIDFKKLERQPKELVELVEIEFEYL